MAQCTAPVHGGTGIVVTDGGVGYTKNVKVAFTGGGGSGAEATVSVTNGTITAVMVTAGGAGYTTAPSVVFVDDNTLAGENIIYAGAQTEEYGCFDVDNKFQTNGYFWGFDGGAATDPSKSIQTLSQWKGRVAAWKPGATVVLSKKRRYLGLPEQRDLP